MEATPLRIPSLTVLLLANAAGSDTVIGNPPVIVDAAVPANVVVEIS